ncbi:MAG: glycosyltransferase family 2 protein [Crocinitomicaceae bacterium]|nr:glycosyltransferase family 2 protein [Crocinitomicaceae bacterium]
MNQIAIVILNWNGKDFLDKFLPSVLKYSGDARIVVADNASSDDSVSFLKEHYPSVELVINDSNGGFAKGYNDALKQIKSSYYLLLNSDVEVTEGWLNPLMNVMKDPKVAGCQPKVLSYQDKNRFEHAGACGGFLDHNYYPFCRGRIFEKTEMDTNQYDHEMEVFWTSGACMLIRSEVFHQVNGFDEDFFAHMEEIDMCWRIKRLGHTFKIVPSSKVYHVGGGTLSYFSPKKTYLNFRNSLYMITKNHEGLLFFKLFYRGVLDGMAAFMFLLSGKPNHFMAVFKAHTAFYGKLSTMLSRRKILKQSSTTFNETGLYHGSILWAKYFKKIKEFNKLNMRFFKD